MGAFETFVNANLGIRKPLILDVGHPTGSTKAAGVVGSEYIDTSNNFIYEKTGENNQEDWRFVRKLGEFSETIQNISGSLSQQISSVSEDTICAQLNLPTGVDTVTLRYDEINSSLNFSDPPHVFVNLKSNGGFPNFYALSTYDVDEQSFKVGFSNEILDEDLSLEIMIKGYSGSTATSSTSSTGSSTTTSSSSSNAIAVNGYYPLFTTESASNAYSEGDGSSHTHVLNGITYYMPNGLGGPGNGKQFHGNFSSYSNTRSLLLDGVNQYASIDGLALSGAFTLSMWFNLSSFSSSISIPLFYKDYATTGTTDVGATLVINEARFYVYDRSQTWGNGYNGIKVSFTPSINTWYHIAYVYTGATTAGAVKIFINGSEMSGTNEHVSSFGGLSSPSSTLAHVGYAPLSNKYANAKFDEIAIWQSDQSSNMSSIYTGPEPVDLSGLSTPPDEWFRLEQNTNNSSGSASVTLYNAPSYSTDVPGAPGGGGGGGGSLTNTYSVDFDGSNQYMAVTDITLPSAKTVSFWVRWQGATNAPAVLFGDNSGNYYPYMDNNRDLKLSNRLQLTSWDLGASNGLTDAWSHIAIVGDGTTAKLYKDGIYIGSGAARAPGGMDKLGGASLSGSRHLNGHMDEFAIFSSALSDGGVSAGQTAQGDIATLYNNGSPGDLSSLAPLHWWRMGDNDSGTGTTITDQGSGGNDGTLVNGPNYSTDVPGGTPSAPSTAISFSNSYSLEFNENTDFVAFGDTQASGNNTFHFGTSPFSLSVWIKPSPLSGDDQIFGAHLGPYGWTMYSSASAGTAAFYFFSSLGNLKADNITIGVWNHLVVTRDGTALNMYVNKSKTSHTVNALATVNTNESTTTRLGYNGDELKSFLGVIDEAAAWNVALTDADVAALFDNGPNNLNAAESYNIDRSNNLLAWYRNGDTGADASGTTKVTNAATGSASAGSNVDGTISGASFSTDVPGATPSFNNSRSLSYDCSNDYASATGLGLSGATSFSMWFNPQATSNFYPLFHADPSGVYIDVALGSFRAYIYDNTNSGYLLRTYTLNPVLNTWYHLAVTVDAGNTSGAGASASLKLYVNGAEVYTTGAGKSGVFQTFNYPSSLPLDIGARTSSSTYAQQLMDEVAIFNSELSATNISDIYNSGVPTDLSSLSPVAWWRMEEGSGTSVVNTANSGTYDLTLVNGPTFSTDVPT